MTSCDDLSQRCEICDPIGLRIMPVRHAVAHAGPDVRPGESPPPLDPQFETGTELPSLDKSSAEYTLRFMRAGYLMMYEEACETWRAFEVDQKGCLREFDVHQPLPPATDGGSLPEPCGRRAGRSVARCIQIPDAQSATKVWLAFSDAIWTQATRDAHVDADYRSQHMRCIDVGAWVGSGGATRTAYSDRAERAPELVSEYRIDSETVQSHRPAKRGEEETPWQPYAAFRSSPYQFTPTDPSELQGVVSAPGDVDAEGDPEPPALMVVVSDPAGVAAELSALMNERLDSFLNEEDRVRPLANSMIISGLRDAEEEQVVLQAVLQTESANESINAYLMGRVGHVPPDVAVELTPADLESIRTRAWTRYLEAYDESARAQWQERHDADLSRLNDEIIKPLAHAHQAILQGETLQVHLRCNYDTADLRSGAAYLSVVTNCIGVSQDKIGQFDLYAEWLGGSLSDRNNLLLRAFCLNNDDLAEQLAEAAGRSNFKATGLPWDQIIALYDASFDASGSPGLNGWFAALVQAAAGPIAKCLREVTDGFVEKNLHALVAVGGATRTRFTWVSTEATTRQIVKAVADKLEAAHGRRPNARVVKAELRRLEILGVSLRQRHAIGFIGVAEDGSITTRERFFQDRERLITRRLGQWRSVMDRNVAGGLATGILQVVAVTTLYREATRGMDHQRNESWARFSMASMALMAGVSQTSGTLLGRLQSPRFARRAGAWRGMVVFGKIVGPIAGIAMAFVDAWRATSERSRGNTGLAIAYGASAMAGVALMIALAVKALVFAAILFALVIAIALLIDWLTPNSRAQWLERSMWGKKQQVGEGFSSLDVELANLEAALR